MQLPSPRGVLSSHLIDVLAGKARLQPSTLGNAVRTAMVSDNPIADEDVQLSLWVLYELHYRGFDGVDDRWEWEPHLLKARRELEECFEAELRRRASSHVTNAAIADGDLPERLFGLVDEFEGPSITSYLQREATADQFKEMLVHRSIYQLKEADPHSWAIPRLPDLAKVPLVELQYDEYGAGRPERQHAKLFADGLAACGLDREYGAYLDQVPGSTLALSNAMSLFGLHRRLRGAAMGHLAALEATSSLPCRKYVGGVRRLGLPEEVAIYFDEHVEADAVHEQIAARDICGTLVEQEPQLAEDVFFGAAVCLLMDAILAEHLLGCWQRGRSSLRPTTTADEAVA